MRPSHAGTVAPWGPLPQEHLHNHSPLECSLKGLPTMRSQRFLLALALLLALVGATRPAAAASISYGDFIVSADLRFEDVTESSGTDPVPLYGPPAGFSLGLDFDPLGFLATASGGAQDITDGQLNFSILSSLSEGISTLNLFEAGDYTLAGGGTSDSQAIAGAILRASVTQIDGVDIAPMSLVPVNASVGFNLAANAGVVQPWSLGLGLDVAAQLLSLGFGPDQRATRLEVVIDNQLLALSEVESVSLIAKKDFRIDIGTVVPEPSAALLLIGAFLVWPVVRRRG
jgi:hypothetical protein